MVKYILVIDINNWNIYKYMYVIYILNYLLLVNYVFFKKKINMLILYLFSFYKVVS